MNSYHCRIRNKVTGNESTFITICDCFAEAENAFYRSQEENEELISITKEYTTGQRRN